MLNVISSPTRLSTFLVAAFLLSSFFLLATGPIIEGDLFWHLATGEWICKHKTIPAADPFSYTSLGAAPDGPAALRHDLLLKGYWLSQIIFYCFWLSGGEAGVILFRAGILTAILLVLYRWMRKERIGFGLSIVFLGLAGYFLRDINDRPQNFSFLFFPLAAILLETMKTRLDSSDGASLRPLFWPSVSLISLMAVWANMHGGYVMGVVLVCIYLFAEFILPLKNRAGRRMRLTYGALLLATVFATLINPITYRIVPGLLAYFAPFWDRIRGGAQVERLVVEMMSPVTAFLDFGNYNPTYWILISITAVVVFLKARSLAGPAVLSLVIFSVFSLLVQRNIPFFLGLVPVLARETDSLVKGRLRKTTALAAALVILATAGLLAKEATHGRILNFQTAKGQFPGGAVNYLKTERPPGNLFNFIDWGGYLMLNLPDYKVFADGRRLFEDVDVAHTSVLLADSRPLMGVPVWKALLESYRVDVILIPLTNARGEYYPLAMRLYEDSDFRRAYRDETAVVYVRNRQRPRGPFEP